MAALIVMGLFSAVAGEPPRTLEVPAYVDELVSKGDAAVGELVAALQGPHAYRAIDALGRVASGKAVQPLLPLTESADGETRAAAAWALGRCKDPAALPALLKLAGDAHAPARAAATWALGRIADPKAADALRQAAQDPDRNVRLAAVRGIGEGKQPAFFAVITPRLDYQAKMVAVEDAAGKPKDPPELVEKEFWIEPDPAVRLACEQALADAAVLDAAPALIYAMEREISFNRIVIVRALESLGPPAASVCLGRIVPTPYTKEAFDKRMPLLINNGTLAVIAGRLGDARCVPCLLKTLALPQNELGKDKDLTELYIATVEMLGRYKVDQAARPLAELLKLTRIQQLSAAIQAAIVEIGRPAARPLARNAADWSLAPIFLGLLRQPQLRTPILRDTIVKFLSHESDQVRHEATETLGLYIYEGVLDQYDVPLLESMYLDPDRSVRHCASAAAPSRLYRHHLGMFLMSGAKGFGYLRGGKPEANKITGPWLCDDIDEMMEIRDLLHTFGPILRKVDHTSQVGVYYPFVQSMYDTAGMAGHSTQMTAMSAMMQLSLLGYSYDVLTDEMIDAGELSRFKVVVAPLMYYLLPKQVQALEAFAANGGTLITGTRSTIIPKGTQKIDDDFQELPYAAGYWDFNAIADVGHAWVGAQLRQKAPILRKAIEPVLAPHARPRGDSVVLQTGSAGSISCTYVVLSCTRAGLAPAELPAGPSRAPAAAKATKARSCPRSR